MKKYRTDYPLWGFVSGGLFVSLGAIILTTTDWTPEARTKLPADLLNLVFWSGVFGWVIHAVAVMCGIQVSRTADQQQRADYDDKPPAQPPG